jgi:trk system potassium uptake protein
MKTLIIGAGDVGVFLTGTLVKEGHSVTVIDNSTEKLEQMSQSFDLLTLQGDGANPRLLHRAGIDDMDLVLAVTNCDKTNILASLLARENGVSRIVARVDTEHFMQENWHFDSTQTGVIHLVQPTSIITREITALLRHSAVLNLFDFADGKIQVMELSIKEKCDITGVTMQNLAYRNKDFQFRVMLVIRDDRTFVPTADDQVLVGDKIYIVFPTAEFHQIIGLTGQLDSMAKRIMIYGGSQIASELARHLEKFRGMQIKLIEEGASESTVAASGLTNTLVLSGEATDIDLLAREGIMEMDTFIALAEDEEKNLISSLMAQHLKVKRTITLIEKADYLPIASTIGLDVVINKQTSTASAILQYIRQGKVVKLSALTDVDSQIIEYEVSQKSPCVGKQVKDLRLPENSLICGVYMPGQYAEVPWGETLIRADDRVTVFAMKESLPAIEKMFGT